ncbi:MAG: branched-chain amino acid ABC transporter permease, partial [Rhodobacteraceae bacterium]|nr:branched-chain amino acid ABC transporter permease [Paracoccaceae bacterium]
MTDQARIPLYFGGMIALILLSAWLQSWNSALLLVNMGLVSAVMALGLNLQWGIAGLFNVGIMGFVALGGVAAVLISMPPTPGAWQAGGPGIFLALFLGAGTVVAAIMAYQKMPAGRVRSAIVLAILIGGFFL